MVGWPTVFTDRPGRETSVQFIAGTDFGQTSNGCRPQVGTRIDVHGRLPVKPDRGDLGQPTVGHWQRLRSGHRSRGR